MTGDPTKLSCAEFQARLPELIASGEDAASDPHLETCTDCRAFVASLEAIADAARQLFPSVEPPDEVWERIESAIMQEDGDEIEPGNEPQPER
jgi:hypothetical protein